jgi:hypothetical protein
VEGTGDAVVSGPNGGGCVGDDVDTAIAGVEDDVVGDRINTNNTEEDKAATHNPVSSRPKPFSYINHSKRDSLCFSESFSGDHDERRRWDSIQ